MEASAKITKSIRKEDARHEWWVVDASDMTVGRLATQVATLLRGKHRPWYTPHIDCGDFVVVINAEKIQLQGKRVEQKEYFHHTGYPGGVKIESFKQMIKRKPSLVIENAVKGMLPKSKLGRKMIKKLKVYAGNEHPHAAQQPKEFALPY